MNRINVIVSILLLLVAVYIIYGAFTDTWSRTHDILLIILLAGGLVNSTFAEWFKRKKRREETDKSENQ